MTAGGTGNECGEGRRRGRRDIRRRDNGEPKISLPTGATVTEGKHFDGLSLTDPACVALRSRSALRRCGKSPAQSSRRKACCASGEVPVGRAPYTLRRNRSAAISARLCGEITDPPRPLRLCGEILPSSVGVCASAARSFHPLWPQRLRGEILPILRGLSASAARSFDPLWPLRLCGEIFRTSVASVPLWRDPSILCGPCGEILRSSVASAARSSDPPRLAATRADEDAPPPGGAH